MIRGRWRLFQNGPAFPSLVVCLLLLAGLAACAQGGANAPANDFAHPPTKGPTPTLVPAVEIDLSQPLDGSGQVQDALVLDAPDGCLRLEIDPGVTVLGPAGQPPASLTLQPDYAFKLPVEAYGVPISSSYRFGPDEIRFSAPVKIVFTCLKNIKKTQLTDISLGMQHDNGQWDQLSVQGDEKEIWTRLERLQPGWRYILVGPAPMGS